MPRLKVLIAIVIILCITAVSFVRAEPELTSYLSFTVPGLDGAIEKIELADIDGDDFAELLLCDGHHLVMISVPGTILFADTLDEGYPAYEIELADVNRDSVADITIALCYMGSGLGDSECKVICYDSARNDRRLTDQVFYDSNYSQCSSIRDVMLESCDVDNDGYNELLFSYERSLLRPPYTTVFYWCLTEGDARVYHSYPDSTQTRLDSHIDGLWKLPAHPGYPVYLTHVLTEEWFNIGPDYSRTRQYLCRMDEDFALTHLISQPVPNCYDNTGIRSESRLVLGSLIGNDPPLTLICSYSFGVSGCVVEPPEDPSDRGLVAYHLHPNDSVSELWSRSTIDHMFDNFITHPSFPEQFFAIAGDTLKRFSANDGSTVRVYDPLPEGMKFWDYPYGEDNDPCLVIVHHDTVSYYGFDAVTDVEGNSNPTVLPESFTLGQPFPNPFNPEITIPVRLGRGGHLTIEVVNALGRSVKTLQDGPVRPGDYEFPWDASDYATGIYFFHATFDETTRIEKAVLVK